MTEPEVIAIWLNGEQTTFAVGTTVAGLVESLGRDPRTVAVEFNREILPRGDYQQTVLSIDDRVEIVHFVQGG